MLCGELDIAAVPELRTRLKELQAEGRGVVMDLSQLQFIDSSGLEVLAGAIRSAGNSRWRFVIAPDLAPQVSSVFRLTAFDRFAGIDRDEPSA